jgi:hypothetical protein
MYDLPEAIGRQREILKCCFRIEHLRRELLGKNKDLEDLLVFVFRYGYANIAMGNVSPNLKEETRQWVKLAHQVCRSEGLDTESMFAPEIANALVEIKKKRSERVYKPYYRARQKLITTALGAGVSALKSESFLIGDEFVHTIGYHYNRGLLFTPEDKQILYKIKGFTLDNLIRAIWKLGDTRWLKGDLPKPSSRDEFVEDAKLATWIAIEEVRVRYYQSGLLKPGAVVTCNETPQKGDDTRMLDIRVGLYFDFEQCPEEGTPTSVLSFFIVNETPIN